MNTGKILKWIIALAIGVVIFLIGLFIGRSVVGFEGRVPNTVNTYEVSFSKDLGNVKIYMPENWISEIDKDGNENTTEKFSIDFSPKGQEGKVQLIYCDNAEFVTGERFVKGEDIIIGEKKGIASYQKGKNIWDYIKFEGYTGEYLIYAKDIEWLEEYEDELKLILAEATFGEGILNEKEAIEIALQYVDEDYDKVRCKYEAYENRWSVEFTYDEVNSMIIRYVYLDCEGNYLGEAEILNCG